MLLKANMLLNYKRPSKLNNIIIYRRLLNLLNAPQLYEYIIEDESR
jgi:hypothetical protein